MKNGYFRSAATAGNGLVAFLLLVCMAAGCRDVLAAERNIIWQSRDQFVALEHKDQSHGGQLPNDHPAGVTSERLTAILGNIDLRSTDYDKPVPLFKKETIDVFAPQLQKALHLVSATEDVTFAVIGLHSSLVGFAKSPKVTTGRVFYKGGNLNIIIGLAHKDFNELEDRRLSPFTPGSRIKASAEDWSIVPHAGIDNFVQLRRDWIAFDDKWQAAAASQPVTSSEVKLEKSTQPPAERLILLNDLKEKGLITHEEYRAKRQEILDAL